MSENVGPHMPASPAFPAATVMAFRCEPGPPEVFLVRRNTRMGFFAGAYVFPGGRVDPADRDADPGAWCTGADQARRAFHDVDALEAISYYLAAVRELFEEAGILIASDRSGRWAYALADEDDSVARQRRAVHSGGMSLRAALEPLGLKPALDALTPIAHWVTPEVESKRFDTRFFVASVEGSLAGLHDDAEHVDSAWMTPSEALARFDRREIVLAPPTWRMLSDFRSCANWTEIDAQARAIVVRRIQPRFVQEGGADLLVVPGDPLYPAPPGERLSPPTRFRREPDRWQPTSA